MGMEKMKEIRRDIIVYSVLLAAAVIVYVWVIPNQIYLSSSAAAESFSPDTFPRFAAIVFFLAALGGLANALRLYRGEKQKEKEQESKERGMEKHSRTKKEIFAELVPYLVFGLVFVYGILFSKIGFVPATVIIPPLVLFLIGCRKWHYYGIFYAFAGILYLLFRYILLVPIR